MEKLTERSCRDFAAALASREPVPGGGGASALVSAIGTALCSMVGNFTLGKKKYAEAEEDIRKIMAEAEELRASLLQLVEDDAAMFEPLSRAYSIPKDDPGRDGLLEACLHDAAAAPAEILRLSCRAIDLHREMGEKGSSMMLSDVGTGVVFCWSALQGAALNVKVNTKIMKDRAFADALNREVDDLLEKYRAIAEETYLKVKERFE